mmetsp:Transcript_38657/g.122890  ORF Transcript_38657/g.122890 Transcript_38657/m.122890 type:complete len:208 (+) Transcript_38657:293-916(+)
MVLEVEGVDEGRRRRLGEAGEDVVLGALDVHLDDDRVLGQRVLLQQPHEVVEPHADRPRPLGDDLVLLVQGAAPAARPRCVEVEALPRLVAHVDGRRRHRVHAACPQRLEVWSEAGIGLQKVGIAILMPGGANIVGEGPLVAPAQECLVRLAISSAKVDEEAGGAALLRICPMLVEGLALTGGLPYSACQMPLKKLPSNWKSEGHCR